MPWRPLVPAIPSPEERYSEMMALWVVRAGRHGEHEDTALEKGLAIAGWEELPDPPTRGVSKRSAETPLVHPPTRTRPSGHVRGPGVHAPGTSGTQPAIATSSSGNR